MNSAKLPSADHQLLEAIARDPGHVLMYYARPIGMSPKLALMTIEHLIARGAVKRNKHTEQLSEQSPETLQPKPALEVPAFVTKRFVTPPATVGLQELILQQLASGEHSTCEIAAALNRKGPAIGSSLHKLRESGLVVSSGPIGKKLWRLVELHPAASNPVDARISADVGADQVAASDEATPSIAATRSMSRSEQLRCVLRTVGPRTARQLADATGIDAHKVGALLAWDIKKGRVAQSKATDQPMQYLMAEPPPAPARMSMDLAAENDSLKVRLQQIAAQRDYFRTRFNQVCAEFNVFESAMRAALDHAPAAHFAPQGIES